MFSRFFSTLGLNMQILKMLGLDQWGKGCGVIAAAARAGQTDVVRLIFSGKWSIFHPKRLHGTPNEATAEALRTPNVEMFRLALALRGDKHLKLVLPYRSRADLQVCGLEYNWADMVCYLLEHQMGVITHMD